MSKKETEEYIDNNISVHNKIQELETYLVNQIRSGTLRVSIDSTLDSLRSLRKSIQTEVGKEIVYMKGGSFDVTDVRKDDKLKKETTVNHTQDPTELG